MVRAGLATSTIAELLGTTQNVVNVTPQKQKKAAALAKGGPRRKARDTAADG